MSAIYKGTVKWFNNAKGFGFIEHENGKDVFVHYSVIQTNGFKTLKDGEPVEYELSEGDKGLHAMSVHRVNEAKAETNGSSLSAQIEVEGNEQPAETTVVPNTTENPEQKNAD